MSHLPIDPSNEASAEDVPLPSPSQELILYNTPEEPPTRFEDLDPPYSEYPAVPLGTALYPENAVYALGIRQVIPNSTWVFEKWFNWSAGDHYAIYLNDLINVVASDTAKPMWEGACSHI